MLRRLLGIRGRSGGSSLCTTEVLNRAIELCVAKNFGAYSRLIDENAKLVYAAYDDFFTVGTEIEHCEEFLLKLVGLDTLRTDAWIGNVHARFLRHLHTSGFTEATVRAVRVVCEHYGRDNLQHFLDLHATLASGHDPSFRPNMHNYLIAAMRPVVEGAMDESFALQILLIYLLNGIAVNSRYKLDSGQSAVHYAAQHGLWQCVELLLQHHADIDLYFEGTTARSTILASSSTALLSLAPPRAAAIPDPALFVALHAGQEEEFVRLFNEAKHQVAFSNVLVHDGWNSLLQLAATRNLIKAVEVILNSDLIHSTHHFGLKDSPILLAAENGHLEITTLLVSHGLGSRGEGGTFDVTETGDHGDSVLHKVARWWGQARMGEQEAARAAELVECLAEALTRREQLDVNALNSLDETPFQLFALGAGNCKRLTNFLLQKGAFLGLDRNDMAAIHNHDLLNMLDSNITTQVNSKGYKIVNFDFECFQMNYKNQGQSVSQTSSCDLCPEMLPLYKISKSPKHSNLLPHPLITSFLDFKWMKIYWIYFINLSMFLGFVVSLTTFVAYTYAQTPKQAPFSATFAFLFWLFILVREILQVLMSPSEYFRIFESWLHVIAILLTPVLLFIVTSHVICVILILVTYSEFSLLLGRHPSIARYIAMFLKVSKVNILLLAISAPFIFAFAVCFFVLFNGDESTTIFKTPLSSMFKTVIMATGELDASDLHFELQPLISELVFILFVLSIEVILMNLLHALAVHDTEGIQRDADIISLQAKIELYTKIESAWLGYPMDWYHNKWGYAQQKNNKLFNFWLKISVKLKSLIDISVLPFPDTLRFKISLREDGKVMEGSSVSREAVLEAREAVRLGALRGLRLLAGVSLQKVFATAYEHVVSRSGAEEVADTVHRLTQELRDSRQEITAIRTLMDQQNTLLRDLLHTRKHL